jgi:hypothetical protein
MVFLQLIFGLGILNLRATFNSSELRRINKLLLFLCHIQ